jgi:hypothetical protein
MPTLLEALPRLSDLNLVSAVAGHLRRPWARPDAFDPLLEAFRRWAVVDHNVGWHLGDALGTASTITRVDELLTIAHEQSYGWSRQMVVMSLGRYRKRSEVAPVLVSLLEDPDVALHAISALRRVLGPGGALPHVEAIARHHHGTRLGETAAREVRKLQKATR